MQDAKHAKPIIISITLTSTFFFEEVVGPIPGVLVPSVQHVMVSERKLMLKNMINIKIL